MPSEVPVTSAALRQTFLDYFAQREHTVVASSPLVPANDPTLLFTNAGMVQFKEVFLGRERRPYRRAVSVQRCMRAGGKHNDLEKVGYTARHHTFFEMLGNFSFGDYFKREAIRYAWEFLIEVLRIPPERLWVTVFTDDDEAAAIWLDELGIDRRRFSRCGAKDNFWSMGETGPCGPCSEIFYDHGPAVPGGPPGSAEADGDRYVEIWNLVFMQFNRDAAGLLTPLPHPAVDTGMGLERLAAVMQGVHSNYEIDLFRHLIAAAAATLGATNPHDHSLRVIADHLRAAAFLVLDGVVPGNEGRGYVQRRIIRRALRHGYRLGQREPFLHRLVGALVAEMGDAYPALAARRAQIEHVLRAEEERFAETLDQGLRIFEELAATCSDGILPGAVVFKLYDTYGFPVDLTADIARERGLELDLAGFEQAMSEQRARARAASQFGVTQGTELELAGETDFVGYETLADEGTVVALYVGNEARDLLTCGEEGLVVLDVTPFYAESGGQVGDTGLLLGPDRAEGRARFAVVDTRKQGDGVICHFGRMVTGELQVGDVVQAQVDEARRRAIAAHHSATHLLHAALRTILGEHVQQRGSLVGPDRLRFDFTHFAPVSAEQLRAIERLVNQAIRANHLVETRIMDLEDAKASGALALFGEKYGEQVRVLRMGDFSVELCGGTHVRAVGDIGLFKIVAETGIASGVRRIEALAGEPALRWIEDEEDRLRRIARLVKGAPAEADAKVEQLVERARRLEKELEQLKAKLASAAGAELLDQARTIGDVRVLAAPLAAGEPKALRETLDRLKTALGSGIVVLAAVHEGKAHLIAGVTKDLVGRFSAGELIAAIAGEVGGRGGGRADMAQAGGPRPEGIPAALALVEPWVRQRLETQAE